MRVYLDYAATTPMLPEVIEAMHSAMQNDYGNPSSIHHHGRISKAIIEDARKTVAQSLKASLGEIFFTSSATESNYMALVCAVRDLGVKRIISSPIEHHCITHTLEYLEANHGTKITYLGVDEFGNIDIQKLVDELDNSDEKTLVSLMYVNNEIGTCHDIQAIGTLCKDKGALFHSDTVQGVGKLPLNLQETPLNFLSASAHKFYGPKGVGFVYINGENPIKPILVGGSQERNMRSGTENLYGIIGLAKALEIAVRDQEANLAKINTLRNYFKEKISGSFSNIQFLGNQDEHFSPYILNILFPATAKSEMLTMNLDINGISVSSGSACSSGAEHQSHVLQHINADPTKKPIRFSFSHFTTQEEVDYVLSKLPSLI